jgi:hypothetical protein
VAADVREKRKVIVAAGAEARGRIRRLERREDGAYAVGLEFTHIETVQGTTRFYANVQDVEKRRDISWTLSKPLPRGTEEVWLPYLPGVAQFFVTGPRLELPKGFRTVWKTKSPR